MTLERFSARIAALKPDETELVTRSEFELLFGLNNSDEQRKELATVLADGLSCSVRILGLDECYAAFTKRQSRSNPI